MAMAIDSLWEGWLWQLTAIGKGWLWQLTAIAKWALALSGYVQKTTFLNCTDVKSGAAPSVATAFRPLAFDWRTR